MAESVSAANEVKLTEAEREELRTACRDWDCVDCGGLAAVVTDLLGARLSAREPDNKADGWPAVERVRAYIAAEMDAADPLRLDVVAYCETSTGETVELTLSDLVSTVYLAAVPVSGVPTEAVRELAEVWAEVHREEDDALDDLGLYHVAYRECAADLAALVQRAAETNESET